jgi:hypothetical protein
MKVQNVKMTHVFTSPVHKVYGITKLLLINIAQQSHILTVHFSPLQMTDQTTYCFSHLKLDDRYTKINQESSYTK